MPVSRRAAVAVSGVVLAGVLAAPAVAATGFASGWQNATVPNSANTTLNAVAAAADGSAFAVGNVGSLQVGLFEYSGGAWTRTNAAIGLGLTAVAAASADNAWAGGIGFGGVTLHWNGGSWTNVSVTGGIPLAMSAAADGTSYVITGTTTSGVNPTTVSRWNGSGWTTVSIPGLSASTTLSAVDVLSASDVWVAGVTTADGTSRTPVVEHYNGGTWTKLATPPGGWGTVTAGDAVTGIAATTSGTAYLLRAQNSNSLPNSALIGWNGSSWTEHGTPTLAQPLSVAADGGTGAWVVPSSAATSSLYFHWTGSAWATAGGPARSGNTSMKAITQIPGSSELWSAGVTGSTAAIEHYAP